jgi:formate hydrogenlyase transcriptional activator
VLTSADVAKAAFSLTSTYQAGVALNEPIGMEGPKTTANVVASSERYRTLLEINNAIITHLNRENLLHAVSKILRRVVPFRGAVITLYNPQKDNFRYVAIDSPVSTDHFRVGAEFSRADSISAWVFDNQRAVFRGDIEKEQSYPNDRLVVANGVYSDCIVPLIVGGKSIGTLNVGSGTKNQYSAANVEILQDVANQVALAVSNMTAYEEIAALNTRVENTAARYRTLLEVNNAIITHLSQEELLRSISRLLRSFLPFDGAVIMLYDPKNETFRYYAMETTLSTDLFRTGMEVGRKESMVTSIFDQQRGRIRRDLEKEQQFLNDRHLVEIGIASDCIVPLIIGGKSIGTLGVGSTKKNQYSEADMELLQEVANQVALAVSNMQSYEEIADLNIKIERTAARYRTLLEINNAIITNLTQQSLLHAISEALKPVVAFDRCAITLYQPANDTFRFLAVEGDLHSDHFRAGMEYARSETCVSWVFDHQRPLVRRDLEKEQEYANEHRLVSEGLHSLCVLPLIFQAKCMGTLSLVSRERERYSDEDAEFLQEVANQVALAVSNMRSYQEINELKARLEIENVYLQEEIRTDHNFDEITGNSHALLAVLHKVEQVAPTDSTVLIHGETGTGKELIARAIHDRSARKSRPLVKVNCSAISAGLVESELFGHVKGAFTGALERHIGRFELADGGTIFLDEIGELPLATQVKLLRVLQEREFEAVGSNRPIRVDVRVIAATNRNLQESIRTGDFRSDLFYRLNVFPIDVPPLRERCSDIPQLAMYFLARFAKKFGKDIRSIPRATLDRLSSYSWPGNIRELQNLIERAAILSRSSVLELAPDVIPELPCSKPADIAEKSAGTLQPASADPAAPPTLEALDRAHIIAVLNQTGGVVEGPRGAAKLLGLHPNTLRHRIQKMGLKRTPYHES